MGNEKGEGSWAEPKGKGRRVKRRQVQAGDGWTVVTHTASGRVNHNEEILEGSRPRALVLGLTVEKLGLEFRELEKRFRGTACARQLGGLLKCRVMVGEGQDSDEGVENAVCIGIGSFSIDWEHRWRALWQLVLFLFVVKELRGLAPTQEVKMSAQEPLFTPLDISFLSSLDITVLPSALEKYISTATFVFAPFVDWDLLLPVFLQAKDPVLYAGNEIIDDYSTYASSSEKAKLLGICNTVGKEFLREREMIKVPELECHAHALNGLVVYWRKEKV